MKMKLVQMKIQNFMGCTELLIDFAESRTRVYGDNATGKTTLAHAFNWLLFDKNAYGQTDFGIKPFDSSGEVIHRLETSVEATFDVDDKPLHLKKVLREKWTRSRGSAEEAYSGNEISYYVNTVPKKKKEYTEEIGKLINENVFRMITNPLYFNESINWKDRRKMLLDICGNITDQDVIASDIELTPLLSLLQGRTVEELKSIVSSEMKSINKELGIIPSRIAEAELAKPKLRDDVDVSQLEELEKQKKAKEQEYASILNGAEILRLTAELEGLKRDLKFESGVVFEAFRHDEFKERVDISQKMTPLSMKYLSIERTTIPQIDLQIESNARRKKMLSEEWDREFRKAFLGDTCPTCGRELPPEQLDAKKKEFNMRKVESLDAIEAELNSIKKRDNELFYEKAEAKKEVEKIREEAKELADRSDELQKILDAKQQAFEDAKEKKLKELSGKILLTDNAIKKQKENAQEVAAGVEAEIDALNIKIAPIKGYIAEQDMLKRQEERIEELKQSQKNLSSRYTDLERQLYLTEQFVRRKVAMVDERINNHFTFTRFKLFDVQVNGGIAECCEATYCGVPYKDLNTAGRINIGLDIINTLSGEHNVYAPIFIDNMESITKPIKTYAQRVDLIVSEKDKVLRFEKGN